MVVVISWERTGHSIIKAGVDRRLLWSDREYLEARQQAGPQQAPVPRPFREWFAFGSSRGRGLTPGPTLLITSRCDEWAQQGGGGPLAGPGEVWRSQPDQRGLLRRMAGVVRN